MVACEGVDTERSFAVGQYEPALVRCVNGIDRRSKNSLQERLEIDGLGQRLCDLCLGLHLSLASLSYRDILGNDLYRRSPAIDKWRCDNLDRHARTVQPQIRTLGRVESGFTRHHAPHTLGCFEDFLRRNDRHDVPAIKRRWFGCAQEVGCRPIGKDEQAVLGDADGMGQVVDKQPVALLTLAQRLLRRHALAQVSDDGDSTRILVVAQARHTGHQHGRHTIVDATEPKIVGGSEAALPVRNGLIDYSGIVLNHELGGEMSQDLFGRDAEHGRKGCVDIGQALICIGDREPLAHGVDHRPGEISLGTQRLFLSIARNGDCCGVRCLLDQVGVIVGWFAWAMVIQCKGTEDGATRVDNRGRPAGTQLVAQRQVAIVGPQRVGRCVLDDHLGATPGCSATRADALANGNPVDGLHVGQWQTRRGAMAEVNAILVEQKHGGNHARRLALDFARQPFQSGRERLTGGDHLQDLTVACQCRFQPAPALEV